MKRIFNWTFGSIFRTFGRIIALIIISFIISLFFNKQDLLKLIGLDTIKASMTIGTNSGWSSIDCTCPATGICTTCTGSVSTGKIAFGTSANTSGQGLTYKTTNLFYATYNANYTYTISFRTHLGGLGNKLDLVKDEVSKNKWSFWLAGYNNDNVGFSDSYITSASCSTKFDTTTSNGFITTCIVGVNTNLSRLRIEVNFFNNNSSAVSYYSDIYTPTSMRVDFISMEESQGIDSTINNASNNIINNQNQNTQNIIDNQNQNTQDIINSNKVCNIINSNSIKDDNKALESDGSISSNSNYGITDYIRIGDINVITSGGGNKYTCIYKKDKTLILCNQNRWFNFNSISSDAYYIRISIRKDTNAPSIKNCFNGNEGVANSVNDLNDNITDDDTSGATSQAGDFFSSFTTNTHGLTGIITAPLNAIQGLTSKSCIPLVLPLPFVNQNLTLPCMRDIYVQNFGAFMNIYDVITLGIISYWVMVRIFALVKDFKNPEHDEIEVIDL